MISVTKMAWRNLWRNTRRTVLTSLAIAFAIGLTVFTRGIQFGMYELTIAYNVALGAGHVQVHRDGYWDKKTLRNTFESTEVDAEWIAEMQHVTTVSPRLVTEALIAVGAENSSGAQINGIVPSRDDVITSLSEDIVEGRWLLDDDPDGAVIGSVLAKNIGAQVGDTLVYFSQGRYGSMAAGLHEVRGIFNTGSRAIDAFTAYIPLASFQSELNAENRLTAVALDIDDFRAVPGVVEALGARYTDENLEVMDYAELMPDIMSSIAFDKASGAIFLILLLIIAGFGILETILMSVMERFHEFGVMRAIGLHRRSLVKLIFIEAVFIAIVGSLAGNALGYGANLWFLHNPIVIESMSDMYQEYGFVPQIIAMIDLKDQLMWTGIIFGITLFVALWPARVAARFSPVEAIRQV
jgi:putative ABC transport system permease protein